MTHSDREGDVLGEQGHDLLVPVRQQRPPGDAGLLDRVRLVEHVFVPVATPRGTARGKERHTKSTYNAAHRGGRWEVASARGGGRGGGVDLVFPAFVVGGRGVEVGHSSKTC